MHLSNQLNLRQHPVVRTCAGMAVIAAFAMTSAIQADHHGDERPNRGAPASVTSQDAPPPPARETRPQPRRGAPDQAAPLRGQRVAILVGEGFHDGETFMPMAYLANRGAIVTVIGIEPGVIEAYNSDMTIRVERGVNEVSFRQFDAMILPGGKGPSVLRENEDVVNFARDFFESGRPVAAICHGPQVLVTAGVLEGKQATCIDSISSELEEAGAKYEDKPVVRDGNLITSRIPDDIPAFCKKIEKVMIEMAEERQQDRRPATPRQPGRMPGQ
jgi:protease I